jgi:hypothetical protein
MSTGFLNHFWWMDFICRSFAGAGWRCVIPGWL